MQQTYEVVQKAFAELKIALPREMTRFPSKQLDDLQDAIHQLRPAAEKGGDTNLNWMVIAARAESIIEEAREQNESGSFRYDSQAHVRSIENLCKEIVEIFEERKTASQPPTAQPTPQQQGAVWVKASETDKLPDENKLVTFRVKPDWPYYGLRVKNYWYSRSGTFIGTSNEVEFLYESSALPEEKEAQGAETEFIPVIAITDQDGHWYVIPKEMKDDFGRLDNDGADNWVEFNERFDQYRTGGDLNNIQLFKQK